MSTLSERLAAARRAADESEPLPEVWKFDDTDPLFSSDHVVAENEVSPIYAELENDMGESISTVDEAENLSEEDEHSQVTPELRELQTDDKEILGSSLHLRRSMHNTTRSLINNTQMAVARGKNVLSTPKNRYLELRRNATKAKYERKQARVGTSHFKFMNKHYQNVADKHRKKSSDAESRFSKHTSVMKGRVETAAGNAASRNEAYEKRIDYYVAKKIEAERRKQLRMLKREKRAEGLSYFERARFVDALSQEDKIRIKNEAIKAVRAENIKKGKLEEEYVAA